MKRIVAVVLLFFFYTNTNAVLVTFESKALGGKEFYIDNVFQGFIGDTIDLEPGEHNFSVKVEHNYNLQFVFEVTEINLEVKSSNAMRWDDCIENRISRFEISQWNKPVTTDKNKVWSIQIPAPSYKNIGDQGECKSSSSHQTLAKLGGIKATIKSKPSGADFYVRGKKVGITDAEVVIPYTSDRSIDILLRKNGYANCRLVIQPPNTRDSSKTLNCSLSKLYP